MPKYDNNLEHLNFQIQIHISHRQENFFEIKKSLNNKIDKYFNYGGYNNEEYRYDYHSFINFSFKKHMSFLGESKAYIADYREEQGSLVVLFNILIIGIINYGSIRSSIDFFINDIEHITSFVLNNPTGNRIGYDVTATVKEERRDAISIHSPFPNTNPRFANYKLFIISFIIIAIALIFTTITTYIHFQTEMNKNKSDIKLDDFRKLFQEELRNQRIDEYIYKNKELKQSEVLYPIKEVKK